MKYAKRLVLVIAVSLFLGLVPTFVHAVDATPTGDDYWLQDTTLKIAAYARTNDGTNLKYIELFNDSEGLLEIENWKVTGLFSNGVRVELGTNPDVAGQMVPKGHAAIPVTELVDGASFSSGTWETMPPKGALLTSLEVSARADGWKTDVYSLKTSGSGATLKYDDFWVRAQISGESYTSTLSSFTATPQVELHDDGLYMPAAVFPGKIIEVYPYSSECPPNDSSILCGDYIKIHLDELSADLSDYVLRTSSNSSSRTTSNTFHLGSVSHSLSDDGFLTVAFDDDGKRISLTNSGGYAWVEDLYGLRVYDETMAHYESAGDDEQGYSWALGDTFLWQWSTTPMPFGANRITAPVEEAVICPTGKYLNPETGRCRTLEEAVNALAACPEGQYRNTTTNRCRQLATVATATVVACGEGQERNPATNRCRSIASAVAEMMPCDEGYERNPATNRCRKVAGVSTTTANTAQLVDLAKGGSWNIWTWSLVAVAASGVVGYVIYEWRHELIGFGQAIAAKLGKK